VHRRLFLDITVRHAVLSPLQAAEMVKEAIAAGSLTSKQVERQSLLAPLLSGEFNQQAQQQLYGHFTNTDMCANARTPLVDPWPHDPD